MEAVRQSMSEAALVLSEWEYDEQAKTITIQVKEMDLVGKDADDQAAASSHAAEQSDTLVD